MVKIDHVVDEHDQRAKADQTVALNLTKSVGTQKLAVSPLVAVHHEINVNSGNRANARCPPVLLCGVVAS